MPIENPKKWLSFWKWILVALAFLLLLSLALATRALKQLPRNYPLPYGRDLASAMRHRRPPGSPRITEVSGWMTFDYLNRVFQMPPEYLSQKLGISDKTYPRLSIDQYAKKYKLSEPPVLFSVQQAIREYMAQR